MADVHPEALAREVAKVKGISMTQARAEVHKALHAVKKKRKKA